MEENVEYVEKEDEFDIQPPEELHKRRLDLEDEDVDVLTIEPVKVGSVGTATTFEPGQFRMPVLLDLEASDSEDEVVAVGAGQFRRKTPGQDWGGETEGSMHGAGAARAGQNGAKRRRGE